MGPWPYGKSAGGAGRGVRVPASLSVPAAWGGDSWCFACLTSSVKVNKLVPVWGFRRNWWLEAQIIIVTKDFAVKSGHHPSENLSEGRETWGQQLEHWRHSPADPACWGGGGVSLSSKSSARSRCFCDLRSRWEFNIYLLSPSCILKGDSTPAGCLGVSAFEQPVYMLGSVCTVVQNQAPLLQALVPKCFAYNTFCDNFYFQHISCES